MNPILLGGVLGVALMYFLDPNSGRRRRTRTRERMVRAVRVVNERASEAKRLFSPEESVADDVLVGRLRAELGQVVSHPDAIEVIASGGHVTLAGPVLSHEVRPLLKVLRRLSGVRAVSDQLTVYSDPSHVSPLQGGEPRTGERFELLQENWPRAAWVMSGATLVLAATRSRGWLGALFGASGGALLARTLANRSIGVQKTIHVAAPVERVFAFWSDHQNFPRFEDRAQWAVAGPAGVPVQWTAEVTRVVPGELIEWRSIGASDVRHHGSVRFASSGDGGTQVSVRLSYLPPAGAFGHAVATIFGADPKSEMDADLMRMKSMIETGHALHEAALPRES